MRKCVAVVALVAVAFQSYLIQTHIHAATVQDGFLASHDVASIHDNSLNKHKRDLGRPSQNEDPAHCPICQEFMHAGQYVTPIPPVTLLISAVTLPFTVGRTVPAVLELVISHAWRGRAPPHH